MLTGPLLTVPFGVLQENMKVPGPDHPTAIVHMRPGATVSVVPPSPVPCGRLKSQFRSYKFVDVLFTTLTLRLSFKSSQRQKNSPSARMSATTRHRSHETTCGQPYPHRPALRRCPAPACPVQL